MPVTLLLRWGVQLLLFVSAVYVCMTFDSTVYVYSSSPSVVSDTPHESYITITSWYGRFSNNLYSVISALMLSNELNRTLLLEDNVHDYPFRDMFDVSGFAPLGFNIEFTSSGNPKSTNRVLKVEGKDLFYQCFNDTTSIIRLWKALKPSRKYHGIVSSVQEYFSIESGEYIGVHLRSLEKECHVRGHRVEDILGVEEMCEITPKLVSSIAAAYNLSNLPVYVASDGQRPDLEKAFEESGAYFIKEMSMDSDTFVPGVDHFMLSESKLLIGTLLSTFSSTSALSNQVPGSAYVLAWPNHIPEGYSTQKEYVDDTKRHRLITHQCNWPQ